MKKTFLSLAGVSIWILAFVYASQASEPLSIKTSQIKADFTSGMVSIKPGELTVRPWFSGLIDERANIPFPCNEISGSSIVFRGAEGSVVPLLNSGAILYETLYDGIDLIFNEENGELKSGHP